MSGQIKGFHDFSPLAEYWNEFSALMILSLRCITSMLQLRATFFYPPTRRTFCAVRTEVRLAANQANHLTSCGKRHKRPIF
jgi:hypothetical protein